MRLLGRSEGQAARSRQAKPKTLFALSSVGGLVEQSVAKHCLLLRGSARLGALYVSRGVPALLTARTRTRKLRVCLFCFVSLSVCRIKTFPMLFE